MAAWYVVATVQAGDRLENPCTIRGVLGPWSKPDAEAKAEQMRQKHPDQQFIVQHEREAMRGKRL